MAKKLYEESNIQAIANSIRGKCGTTTTYKTCDMAAAIDSIKSETDIELDFSYNYGGTTQGSVWVRDLNTIMLATNARGTSNYVISSIAFEFPVDYPVESNCFRSCLSAITEEEQSHLRLSDEIMAVITSIEGGCPVNIGGMFYLCPQITTLPDWFQYLKPVGISGLFTDYRGTTVPELDFTSVGDASFCRDKSYYNTSPYSLGGVFRYCYNLTSIPESMLRQLKFKNIRGRNYPSLVDDSPYHSTFYGCRKLTAINGMGVCEYIHYAFPNEMVGDCRSLQSFTFETNADGSPIVADWDYASTLDFSYAMTSSKAYTYTSMVETINSLPDVSNNSTGAVHTIKFSTDYGGSELTEEEIAVATARGWTVTLV